MFLNTSRLVAMAAMVLTLGACQSEKTKSIEVENPKVRATAMTTAAAFMVIKNTSTTDNDRLVKVVAEGAGSVEMHTYEHKGAKAGHDQAGHEQSEHAHEAAAGETHAAVEAQEAGHEVAHEAGHEVAHEAATHDHAAHDANVVAMVAVPEIEIPAGTEVELKPGGLHLMLIGLPEGGIQAGSSVKIKLTFEKAGEIDVEVPVVAD